MQSPVPVHAYSFAATFKLREIGALLVERGAKVVQAQDELLATFGDGSSALCVDFGAIVFFGCAAELREGITHAITQRLPGEPHPPLTEDFLVEIRPGHPPEAHFDRVLVPELSRPVISVVGLLLAQSAAMDYYEEDVAEITRSTAEITRQLALRGQLRGSVRSLIQFIGRCILTKNGIIETLALFDKPDVTWQEESLDLLFIRLRQQLEIDDRFRALEYKLRMIQETLELIVDLSRQRQSFMIEVAVFALVLVEVVVMVWQVIEARGH